MATLLPDIGGQFLDDDAHPLTNGLIYAYLAGAQTPVDTYADADGLVPNPNPIVLDAGGRATVFLQPGVGYKFVINDVNGALIRTVDGVVGSPESSQQDVEGIAGEPITNRQPVYLADGNNSYTVNSVTLPTNPGQWYVAHADDPASSTAPFTGIALGTALTGSTVQIRYGGEIDGMSGLVPGADYYVGVTKGTLTTTPPGSSRFLGVAESTTSLVLVANPARAVVNTGICQGRLTLTTMTPVTTADVFTATTVYFTPSNGNLIVLKTGTFTGAPWATFTFTEQSIALGTDTTALPYDVFAYVDTSTGNVKIERLAWTNGTTRATLLTLVDGVLVKTGNQTRRYVGTYYTSATGQTEDSTNNRLVWNMYNRTNRPWRRRDQTDTWTYSVATFRQANGAATNQVSCVCGVAEDMVDLTVYALAQNGGGVTMNVSVAIGENSTTTPASTCVTLGRPLGISGSLASPVIASLQKYPAVGYSYYAWLEYADATGTTTWTGDAGVPAIYSTGITGRWRA